MNDSDIIVTDNTTRPARPDATEEQSAAEVRAGQIIQDFSKGYITKKTAIRVRDAAERSIGSHDLRRGLDNMP